MVHGHDQLAYRNMFGYSYHMVIPGSARCPPCMQTWPYRDDVPFFRTLTLMQMLSVIAVAAIVVGAAVQHASVLYNHVLQAHVQYIQESSMSLNI